MDADGIAENNAAIVVAAFPHMKHPARIAETPAKGSGDLRQDGTGQRLNGFWVVENRRPFDFQGLDCRPRFFDPAALLHGGFERRDGAVVESFTRCVGNELARVFAFG